MRWNDEQSRTQGTFSGGSADARTYCRYGQGDGAGSAAATEPLGGGATTQPSAGDDSSIAVPLALMAVIALGVGWYYHRSKRTGSFSSTKRESGRLPSAPSYETSTTSTADAAATLRLFRPAALVVGVHGAGLANALFCVEGAALLELSLPEPEFGEYEHLAGALGLAYASVPLPHSNFEARAWPKPSAVAAAGSASKAGAFTSASSQAALLAEKRCAVGDMPIAVSRHPAGTTSRPAIALLGRAEPQSLQKLL